DNFEKSVRIHASDVAGLKPSARIKYTVVVVLPIARHHLRSTGADLPCLALGKLVSVVVKDRHFRAGHRYSYGTALELSVQRITTKNWRSLTQSVTFEQGFASDFLPAAGDGVLDRHASSDGAFEPGEVKVLESRGI